VNKIIIRYFDEIETCFIQNEIVVSYKIIRKEITPFGGKLRVKICLNNNEILEFFNYVTEVDGNVQLSKYSFHWQDAQGNLKRRWDNAPHHPELSNYPHHVHFENNNVQGMVKMPDIFYVLEHIKDII